VTMLAAVKIARSYCSGSEWKRKT